MKVTFEWDVKGKKVSAMQIQEGEQFKHGEQLAQRC